MTLCIGVATERGVWLTTDQRLTARGTGWVLDDDSRKCVHIACRDGAALVAYTGLGRLGRIDLSAWIVEKLRGRRLSLRGSVEEVRRAATAELGHYRVPHAFVAVGFQGGKPWALTITNADPAQDWVLARPRLGFEVRVIDVETSPVFMAGCHGAVSKRDRDFLQRVARSQAKPRDFAAVLARINRNAAGSGHPDGRLISGACRSAYLDPEGNAHERSFSWARRTPHHPHRRGQVLEGMPRVADGVDMSGNLGDMVTSLLRSHYTRRDGTPIAEADIAEARRFAEQAVEDSLRAPPND